jgi:predicted enzyme related to lactoylglutathione lyase
MTYTGAVLDAPDPRALADFYRRLLDWTTEQDGEMFVTLREKDGAARLSFQAEPAYEPPTWPAVPGAQQIMAHLDIQVDDLDAAVDHAVAAGATVAAFQPQDHVRVCLDPVGHPFCLYVD